MAITIINLVDNHCFSVVSSIMPLRIQITPKIRQSLIDLKDRTGISVDKLLADRRRELPSGLNEGIINSWYTFQLKSTPGSEEKRIQLNSFTWNMI